MTGRSLSADAVSAFCWDHASKHLRAGICACASLDQNFSLLDWYEIGVAERLRLRHELADIIEHNASAQRAERGKQAERMKRTAA